MIEVVHDNEPMWMPAEPCAFCKTPTRYWYKPKDVAVCPGCAAKKKAEDVPSKREWLNQNRLPGQTLLGAEKTKNMRNHSTRTKSLTERILEG